MGIGELCIMRFRHLDAPVLKLCDARLTHTHNRLVVSLRIIKGSCCFLDQETLPHCLVLVGSSNLFKRDLTIEQKQIESLMVD